MSKPILTVDATYAFDATLPRTFQFKYSGGQIKSNTIIVKNNQTNEIVYTAVQETMLLQHVIPGNTLENGLLYNVTISCTEVSGIESEASAPVIFYCYSTPTFELNVVEGQVIGNASYDFAINYSQSESEQIQSFYVVLYDSGKQTLYTSNARFDSNSTVTISNLEDNVQYYVRAFGETLNHMMLDTGFIGISVKYIIPSMYSYLVAENDPINGRIILTPNITSIEGYTIDGSEPVFGDSCIDTKNGSSIIFDNNFLIKNDFILHIVGTRCGQNNKYLILSNSDTDIVLTERVKTFNSENNVDKLFFELKVEFLSSTLLLYSNRIDIPNDDQMLSLWIKKKDNMYDISGPDLVTVAEVINSTEITQESEAT